MTAVGESDLQLRVLEALESAHRYNRWVADLTLPYLGEEPLEIGSGIGVSAELWLTAGVPSITVTEIDPDALTHLQERFHGDDRVTITTMDLENAPEGQHSSVVALNVLEHIADDVGALRGAGRPFGQSVLAVGRTPRTS
jgi:cyclopropane fatty-acyl-phospholipid synthase-like methyltransferase